MKMLSLIYRQVREIHWDIALGWLLLICILALVYAVVSLCEPDSIRWCHRKKTVVRIIASMLLAWWIFVIVDITLLQDKTPVNSLDLKPFDANSWLVDSGKRGFHERRILNAALNACLFVPGGIACAVLTESGKPWLPFSLALLCALGVEALQFILANGIVISDSVLFRLLGFLVSFWTTRGIRRLIR